MTRASNYLKLIVRKTFRLAGYELMRKELREELLSSRRMFDAYPRWSSEAVNGDLRKFILTNIDRSKSQFQQDLFVLYYLAAGLSPLDLDIGEAGRKRYFVEFGATDGMVGSNTYLLETEFGWEGLVCEPGESWHRNLTKNRSCSIDFRCVYKETGLSLVFNQAEIAEISTIDEYSNMDLHAMRREGGRKYTVSSVSLNDLLTEHHAPTVIDYLSIDTEGSEYDILSVFDFDKWKINIISVEHNYSPQRDSIYKLLTDNGFTRVLKDVSEFDDWYIATPLTGGQESKI